jgi:hypothetical protein
MEVVGKITHEGEKNGELYDLIISSLTKLKTGVKLKDMRFDFIKNILTIMGYWPIGQELKDPDKVLEEVIERQISSVRVGKRMLK